VNCETSQPRLAELARATLGGAYSSDAAAAGAFIERVDRLAEEVGVPKRLGDLGVRREQIPELVRGSRGNSMNGNPRQLDDEELTQLLEDLL
jgi:alcohol dehydrogenase class IV